MRGSHQDELAGLLRVAGVHLLDGQCHEIDGVGFAGTKGFCGGFAPYELMPFGENGIKTFVEIAEREAIKLDYALAQLQTPIKLAITHYAPIKETVVERTRAPSFPFLGSSLVCRASRSTVTSRPWRFTATPTRGTFAAESTTGTPIYNVALHLLRLRGEEHPFTIFKL